MCWVKSRRSRRAASSSSQAHVVSHSFSKAVLLQDKRGDSQGSQGGVLAKGFGNCPVSRLCRVLIFTHKVHVEMGCFSRDVPSLGEPLPCLDPRL